MWVQLVKMSGKRRRVAASAGIVGLVVMLSGCQMKEEPLVVDSSAAVGEYQLTYEETGSTVAPPFRRDYTLTVRGGTMDVRVVTYGDKLVAEMAVPVPDAIMRQVLDRLSPLSAVELEEPEGCAGGIYNALLVERDPNQRRQRRVARCGGTNRDEFDQSKEVVAPLLELLGDLDVAFKRGQNIP
jgi:hypothetical protein